MDVEELGRGEQAEVGGEQDRVRLVGGEGRAEEDEDEEEGGDGEGYC